MQDCNDCDEVEGVVGSWNRGFFLSHIYIESWKYTFKHNADHSVIPRKIILLIFVSAGVSIIISQYCYFMI